MEEPERPPLGRRLRHFLRAQRFVLSIVVLAVGIVLAFFALIDFTPLSQNAGLSAINSVTDQSGSGGPNYDLAFVLAGPIIIIVGAYLVGAYYLARRRFEHLMLSKSKAEFLRNLPEIEELLWDLTPADEERYEEKKSDLRIRR
jgi:uncharacterized protein DUF3198